MPVCILEMDNSYRLLHVMLKRIKRILLKQQNLKQFFLVFLVFNYNFVFSISGHYLFIETSSPRVKGDKAHVDRQWFHSSYKYCCMGFWYHMLGTGVGSLNAYVMTKGSTAMNITWSLSGNQQDMWKYGQFKIDQTNENIKVGDTNLYYKVSLISFKNVVKS